MSQVILIIGRKETIKTKTVLENCRFVFSPLDGDKDVTQFSPDASIVERTLHFSVKFCAAWLRLLRAHFLPQTSDERFRTRRACRSVSSPGLSCAVGLCKAPGDPAARRGERPSP